MTDNQSPLVSVIIPTRNRLDKLIRLIESVYRSNYSQLEIIVVDNNSTNCNVGSIITKFPNIKIINNDAPASASGTKNLGINNCKGDLIFLIDDDNVMDEECISILVNNFRANDKLGLAGPMMYHFDDKKKIWCAGIKRNYYTSKTTFIGRGVLDVGQFSIMESEDFPNAFMFSRQAITITGLLNENLFPFHYYEADIAKRIKNAGFIILFVPEAKVWHDFKSSERTKGTRVSSDRIYYYGRNRVLFHRLYSTKLQLLSFYCCLITMVIPRYGVVILLSNHTLGDRFSNLKKYLRGAFDGLVFKFD